MLPYFGALDRAVSFPIARVAAPDLDAGACLLELDELVTDLDAALRARDDAARQVVILEHRIAAVRAALRVDPALSPPAAKVAKATETRRATWERLTNDPAAIAAMERIVALSEERGHAQMHVERDGLYCTREGCPLRGNQAEAEATYEALAVLLGDDPVDAFCRKFQTTRGYGRRLLIWARRQQWEREAAR